MKSPVRHLPTVARILMGLMFFVFGLNGFLHFIPQPKEPMPDGVMALMGGFMQSGYMMPLIFGTQTLVGALLLLNAFVPLALALIAPVIVNIIAFHIFLMPSTIAPGIVVLVLELYLAWSYREVYRPMLALRTKPGGG
ncbi:MAG TPA: DoxX family protein [Verrucomicrobiae bacterium]|nr:DoxX family protein [Verrucomicrobiae bacterium]